MPPLAILLIQTLYIIHPQRPRNGSPSAAPSTSSGDAAGWGQETWAQTLLTYGAAEALWDSPGERGWGFSVAFLWRSLLAFDFGGVFNLLLKDF